MGGGEGAGMPNTGEGQLLPGPLQPEGRLLDLDLEGGEDYEAIGWGSSGLD